MSRSGSSACVTPTASARCASAGSVRPTPPRAGCWRRSRRPSSVIGATFVRELAPGELVVIDEDGPREPRGPVAPRGGAAAVHLRVRLHRAARQQALRPRGPRDPVPHGRAAGRRRRPPRPTWSWACPSRVSPAAEGFARASGIPYGQGLVKNRYIGRSFIAPDQQERGRRGAAQAQPARRRHRRQAPGGRGRLHRARHHPALGHPHAARGGRGRGAPAHLVAPVALALLLRHRHAVARGAVGDRPHGRGDGARSSAPTRWPTSASRTSRRPSGPTAGSATPASPATTPRPSPHASSTPVSLRPEPVTVTAHQAALPGV